MSRKTSLEKQYESYLEKYYESLSKYNVDFLRPLTKAEYKNARESYISDKVREGEKIYPSNINRDLVTRSKDYAMTPAQARAYQKGLREMGINVKYKTLRENKAIAEKKKEDVKEYYDKLKEEYTKKGEPVPTELLADKVGEYFFGSPA